MDPSGQAAAAAQAMAQLSALTDLLNQMKIVSYFEVLAVAVYAYDYAITIGMEIQYIWPTRWNMLKILYLIQRYLPLVDTAYLGLHRQFAVNPSPGYCGLNTQISGWILTAGITVSEVILSYRVLAVWERNRTLTIILCIFFLLCWAPTLWITQLFFSSIVYTAPPVPMRGCFASDAKLISYIDWLILLGYETALMILLLTAAAKKSRPNNNAMLSALIYRDGIVYYIYLFVLSVANVLALLMLPKALGQTLAPLERVMYSVLTSRVVLHIREYASTLRPTYKPEHDLSTDRANPKVYSGVAVRFQVETSHQVDPITHHSSSHSHDYDYGYAGEVSLSETERRAHSILTESDVGIVMVNMGQAV